MKIKLPKKLRKVFSKKWRYRGAYGGRGSGKSVSFIRMSLIYGMTRSIRILCARELQNSIKESIHAEIVAQIKAMGLEWAYEWGESYIRSKINGTEYLFKGLRHNIDSIKSMAAIDICLIEEAETISEQSWRDLIPTIRKPGSEIWVIWNPKDPESPTKKRFIDNAPPNSCIVEMNFSDNPWFPKELDEERKHDMSIDYDLYLHVWEGQCLVRSDAQIFNGKWRLSRFDEPNPNEITGGPYYGSDFGFANDPTTVIRCYIIGRTLYISHEAGQVGCDVVDLPALYKQVPGTERTTVRCDSARPELISHLKRSKIPAMSARKWPGSIEDGISFMRSFDEIVIHERCKQTALEFKNYSYKIDKYTKEVLPVIVDKHNHYIDAIRYAIEPMIGAGKKFRVGHL